MEKKKLMYVTKKQVVEFIKDELSYRKRKGSENGKEELLIEIEDALLDMKQYPDDCRNQIKWWKRVYEELKFTTIKNQKK